VRRILIVDDEPAVREAIAMVLREEGYLVLAAPDGRAALEMISAAPDLLITDLLMPDLDGWGLLDQVREQDPTLPVILMSAIDPTRWRGVSLPALDHVVFLPKPFDLETLLATVAQLSGRRET
jgi:DNA-binding response OmpR family regulator